MEPTPNCCICGFTVEVKKTEDGKVYWNQGNNPEPVSSEGRCCDTCNELVVIPARLQKTNDTWRK
jgi:hypothetical protein